MAAILLVQAGVHDGDGELIGDVGDCLQICLGRRPWVFRTERQRADHLALGDQWEAGIAAHPLTLQQFNYLPGRFLGVIAPTFALVALLGLILTSLGLLGNLARVERRLLFIEIDAAIIFLVYLGGMWFLYARGIGA